MQHFAIENWEVVNLQRVNIVVAVCPPRFCIAASGIIFQDTSVLDCKRGIHATFKALIIVFKSVILRPPCFLSPMMVDFFIFAGFPSQIKLKINFSISLINFSATTEDRRIVNKLRKSERFNNVYFHIKCEISSFPTS